MAQTHSVKGLSDVEFDNDICRQIARIVGDQGWCSTPDFLSPPLISQLHQEVLLLWQNGEIRPAGVGRGESFEINSDIRTDHVLWLDNGQPRGAQKIYFGALEQLRLAFKQHLYLGLMEFEAHFAVYPKGSFYEKHLDQFRGKSTRTISAILYLNETWLPEDGGQLRLYDDPDRPDSYVDIFPHGGTLVTFLSARYTHQVLPANRPRKSITGWFKQRENL